jgi:hypothetical protein
VVVGQRRRALVGQNVRVERRGLHDMTSQPVVKYLVGIRTASERVRRLWICSNSLSYQGIFIAAFVASTGVLLP